MLETIIIMFNYMMTVRYIIENLYCLIATVSFWFIITNPEICFTIHMFLVTLYHKKYAYGFFMWLFFIVKILNIRCLWVVFTYNFTDVMFYLVPDFFLWFFSYWLLAQILKKHPGTEKKHILICVAHEMFQACFYTKLYRFQYYTDDEYKAKYKLTTIELLCIESHCHYVNSQFKIAIVEFFMPTVKYRAYYRDLNKECCICFKKFQFGSLVTQRFSCTHVLHKKCCDRWMDINPMGKCPLCRSEQK